MAASERPTYNAVLTSNGYCVEIKPNEKFLSYPKIVWMTQDEYEKGLVPAVQGWKTLKEAFPNRNIDEIELLYTGLDPHENPESCD